MSEIYFAHATNTCIVHFYIILNECLDLERSNCNCEMNHEKQKKKYISFHENSKSLIFCVLIIQRKIINFPTSKNKFIAKYFSTAISQLNNISPLPNFLNLNLQRKKLAIKNMTHIDSTCTE